MHSKLLQVGGMDGVIVVDVTEDFAQNAAGSTFADLIAAYKTSTLPVLAHFDDGHRLKSV
jgi:hypothetical protein